MTVTRNRVAWPGGGGGAPSLATTSTFTTTSGRMPASSEASRALSTASFTHVSSAFRGLSNPSRWRFLVKNSETEISRWRAPISTAVIVGLGGGAGVTAGTGGGGLTWRLAAAKGSLAYAPIETKSRAWAKFYRRRRSPRPPPAWPRSHRGGGAAELARPQPRERAAIASQQLRGRPFLEEGAIVEDDDAVGMADGRQAMGHDERRPALHQTLEGVEHRRLSVGVEGRRRLVEDEDRRVLDEG